MDIGSGFKNSQSIITTACHLKINTFSIVLPNGIFEIQNIQMEKISYADFDKIEIRTGTILSAVVFEKAKKPAYQLTIDFGNAGIKKSSAQITDYYTADALIGKQVVAVLNFPVKQIANFFSECLVLGAVEDDGKVVLLQTMHNTKNGTRIG